jgi:hypothetical protein
MSGIGKNLTTNVRGTSSQAMTKAKAIPTTNLSTTTSTSATSTNNQTIE